MTNLNTDEMREEGKHATANECYSLLCDTLDEIDRLKDEKAANAYMATGIKIDQTKYREQIRDFETKIEQQTKDAIKEPAFLWIQWHGKDITLRNVNEYSEAFGKMIDGVVIDLAGKKR